MYLEILFISLMRRATVKELQSWQEICSFSLMIAFLPTLGGPELLIIFVLVLIFFGAKKIPEFAKGLGKGVGEFKKAKQEFDSEVEKSMGDK